MKKKDAINEFTEKIKVLLKENLMSIRLFGSKARKDANNASDIDILVEVKSLNENVWDRIMDIAFEVNLKWEVYISPRIVEASKFRSLKWRATPFVQSIEKEGIML
ncbi:MAG: nucleotidyltransferase domain-containing protein [bacterium]